MCSFMISIADRIVKIDCCFEKTKRFCRDYLVSEGEPVFSVTVTEDDIAREGTNAPQKGYSQPYLETLALYRKICDGMARFDTFMMHGAVVAVGESAYMFTAPSGTGKTTHVGLWLKNIPGAYVVNGDKPLVHVDRESGTVLACGTPWCGKEGMNRNVVLPLKAVAVLKRGERNEIKPLSPEDCFVAVMKQIQRPGEEEEAVKVMSLMECFMNNMSFYEMRCNMQDEAACVAYERLTQGECKK